MPARIIAETEVAVFITIHPEECKRFSYVLRNEKHLDRNEGCLGKIGTDYNVRLGENPNQLVT